MEKAGLTEILGNAAGCLMLNVCRRYDGVSSVDQRLFSTELFVINHISLPIVGTVKAHVVSEL